MSTGQIDWTAAARSLSEGRFPPGVVYVAVRTPLGSAYVDPGAAAGDSRTQAILRDLGIEVEVGFGAIPMAAAEEPSLWGSLGTFGLLAAGGLALAILPRPANALAALAAAGIAAARVWWVPAPEAA